MSHSYGRVAIDRLSSLITVGAKPEPISFDPSHSAVIVLDMQNDFGSEGGMFALGGIDISPIRGVIPAIAQVVAAALRAGITVVYLKMGFQPDLSDAGGPDAPNWLKQQQLRCPGEAVMAPDGAASRILVRDTWNTDIVSELRPAPGDIILYKHRFSGFFETDLDRVLNSRSIKHLIFTGCTTSVCVESTLRDGMIRDYTCLLVEDCTAEPIGAGLARSNHDASLFVVQALFGWVSNSAELVTGLPRR